MLIAYCDYAYQDVPSTDPLLLAASLRQFGGCLREAPIRLYLPAGEGQSPALSARADELRVELRTYEAEPEIAAWPFAPKALAAAEAERDAAGKEKLLLWFDRDSLVLGDLAALALPPGASLGYRPVNGRNIGGLAASPVDPFWNRVYELGGLDPAAAGTTRAYMGGEELRFYIAAGLLAVRPGLGVLGAWAALERRCAADPAIAAAGRKSQAQRIFMHQAALSVAAASLVPPAGRLEYPAEVMYPLNFWSADAEARRPLPIDRVLTLRYDQVLEGGEWRSLPMSPAFKDWLEGHVR